MNYPCFVTSTLVLSHDNHNTKYNNRNEWEVLLYVVSRQTGFSGWVTAENAGIPASPSWGAPPLTLHYVNIHRSEAKVARELLLWHRTHDRHREPRTNPANEVIKGD